MGEAFVREFRRSCRREAKRLFGLSSVDETFADAAMAMKRFGAVAQR
jgi:hypothetical protein